MRATPPAATATPGTPRTDRRRRCRRPTAASRRQQQCRVSPCSTRPARRRPAATPTAGRNTVIRPNSAGSCRSGSGMAGCNTVLHVCRRGRWHGSGGCRLRLRRRRGAGTGQPRPQQMMERTSLGDLCGQRRRWWQYGGCKEWASVSGSAAAPNQRLDVRFSDPQGRPQRGSRVCRQRCLVHQRYHAGFCGCRRSACLPHLLRPAHRVASTRSDIQLQRHASVGGFRQPRRRLRQPHLQCCRCTLCACHAAGVLRNVCRMPCLQSRYLFS